MIGHTIEAPRRWLILASIGLGTFVSSLDASMVNTVLPLIGSRLHTSIAGVEWVVTSYLVVVTGTLLALGRLGDVRGYRTVYISGLFFFGAGSGACGLSPSATSLIVCRSVQGLGAAMMFANGPAILVRQFPDEQRGRALGLQAAMAYLGLTAGPAVGGWSTATFGWRAVFGIDVLAVLVTVVFAMRVIPADLRRVNRLPLDLPGSLLWICSLSALVLGLNRGYLWGWSSAKSVTVLSAAGLLALAFLVMERRLPHPIVDVKLFRDRTFSAAAISALLNFFCGHSIVFLLPFYLIQGRGVSLTRTGLLLTGYSFVRAVTAPISGTVSDRIGTQVPTMCGMAILAGGLFLCSRLGDQSPMSAVLAGLMIVAFGSGMFIAPNSSALMGAAPRARQGVAAGVLATSRNLGMSLGIGFSAAIVSTVLTRSHAADPAVALFSAVESGFRFATGAALLGMLTTSLGGGRSVFQQNRIRSLEAESTRL